MVFQCNAAHLGCLYIDMVLTARFVATTIRVVIWTSTSLVYLLTCAGLVSNTCFLSVIVFVGCFHCFR